MSSLRRVLRATALSLATISCIDPPSGPAGEIASTVIEQISPEVVEVTAGSVSPGPTIRLTDARSGRPRAGVAVEFRLREGNGFIAGARTRTDSQGLATSGVWSVPLRV